MSNIKEGQTLVFSSGCPVCENEQTVVVAVALRSFDLEGEYFSYFGNNHLPREGAEYSEVEEFVNYLEVVGFVRVCKHKNVNLSIYQLSVS